MQVLTALADNNYFFCYLKKTLLISLSFLFLFFCGCSSDQPAKKYSTIDISAKNKTEQFNAMLIASSANKVISNDDYRIGPEDLLEIEAYNVEEIKKTLRVNSQGDIALPLIGIIKVKGLTTSELEKLIAEKLEKYVQETVVNVFVREYHSQRISVVGAVKNPQVYAVTGQRYLLDMLMVSGGLKDTASNICYVIRPADKDKPDGQTSTIIIDLDELLIKGNFALNVPVFSGDLINVPEGGIFFVDGAVKEPGAYPLKGKTTIIQALTLAKGLKPEAKLSDIRIFRDNGRGERDIIGIDYDAVKKGELPDILLANNDIIIVPVSGIKNFFNGFISSLRGMISFGSGSLGAGM
ncbi:MAG: polysaccharide biosynthesis/export family protein [Nitrospirae bacterium]|jgi:polysaccharide export outer membrane protein|nr:polysaccharide biosynthesis/export family protein [Nitrospirota bacterium]